MFWKSSSVECILNHHQSGISKCIIHIELHKKCAYMGTKELFNTKIILGLSFGLVPDFCVCEFHNKMPTIIKCINEIGRLCGKNRYR